MRIVSLTTNIPGPLATARLCALGAKGFKVEPIVGDALQGVAPEWYAQLCARQTVVRLDLRSAAGKAELHARLDNADLMISAMRASALERLELGWDALHVRFPTLCHIAIVGERAPFSDRPGHDLTFQARAGLLAPPQMPRYVAADMMAAEQAVSAALAALLLRERGGQATRSEIAIADAAQELHASYAHGLTNASGVLGGGSPHYNLYRSRDGWIALAAIEAHFLKRLPSALEIECTDANALRTRFAQKTTAEWEEIAARHDIPLAGVAAS